jgi:hypothetical protein
MSDFSVQGFVKGKWPIGIVHELEADSGLSARSDQEGALVKQGFPGRLDCGMGTLKLPVCKYMSCSDV